MHVTVLYLVPLVVVQWMLVFWLISRFSGWSQLARIYTDSSACDGTEWRFRSLRLRRWCHYNNCVTIGADTRGLHLRLPWPFSFRHPPLLIPWSQLRGVLLGRGIFQGVQLEVENVPVTLAINQDLADRIEAAVHGVWKYRRSA